MASYVLDEQTWVALGLPLDEHATDTIPVDPLGDVWEQLLPHLEADMVDTDLAASHTTEADTAATEPATADPIAQSIETITNIGESIARLQARELRELASVMQRTVDSLPRMASGQPKSNEYDMARRSLVADLAMAARVSDRTMDRRLSEAETVVERFPATLNALELGAISMGHVRTIVEAGAPITDASALARFEAKVLERATTVTPGRLRQVARNAAEALASVSFDERHAVEKAKRRVSMWEIGDGMSEIIHTLPTVLAQAIWDRLTQQAKAVDAAGDTRTFDQIRSDLAAELLLTADPTGCEDAPHAPGVGIRAEVSIVIPAGSFFSDGDELPTLLGAGPIDHATARRFAADAKSITRILTDPMSDQVLAVDSYRPSEQLRRFLRIRDGRCRFPTCNRNVARCDLDHTIERQHGGPTQDDNLAHLCRNHHVIKSAGRWKVRQVSPGVLEWISPTGNVVTDLPDTPIRFA